MTKTEHKLGARRLRGPHRETPLQKTMDALGIPSARLEAKVRARLQRPNPDRRQYSRWRLGRSEPGRKDMLRILWALRELSGQANLRIDDLFDFDPENPENWHD